MESYLTVAFVVFMAIVAVMQIRLIRMINMIGEMLHVLMYHPQQLDAWGGIDDSENEPTDIHWSKWDESGETDSEEE
jgi:hypothetical protein